MTKRTAKLATEAEAAPIEEPAQQKSVESSQADQEPMQVEKKNALPDLILPASDETIIFLNVRRCSACGSDHDGVPEWPNTAPTLDRFGVTANHYYTCPTTGIKVNIEHREV